MDGVLDITDDLDVYVEEDNNNNVAIMKLTLVMEMMVDKEVDVKLDWEVDEEVGVEVD